jgi:hypothetical protein
LRLANKVNKAMQVMVKKHKELVTSIDTVDTELDLTIPLF